MLGLAENRLRVITPEVGGGFGSKLNVYAEEALMGFVSMKIGKPVKWIESRRENFLCTIHGRGHVDYYEIAAKRDGSVLGLKLKLIQDLGAYHQLLTPAIPTLSVLMMPGLYKFRNVTADIIGVFTNCVPTDAYRGAGRPEATHGVERMMDLLAAELKMDPAEVRLKNFPRRKSFRTPPPPASAMTAATTPRPCRRLWTSWTTKSSAKSRGRLRARDACSEWASRPMARSARSVPLRRLRPGVGRAPW